MKKPFLGSLRRLYNPAVWCHYRQSAHHVYIHSKLHRLQVLRHCLCLPPPLLPIYMYTAVISWYNHAAFDYIYEYLMMYMCGDNTPVSHVYAVTSQVDNQLRDAYFPQVLYPSPVPSFVVKKAGPKPFVECMLVRRQVPERGINTVK